MVTLFLPMIVTPVLLTAPPWQLRPNPIGSLQRSRNPLKRMVIPFAPTIIPSLFMQTRSVFSVTLLVAVHGHGIGFVEHDGGGTTWACAGAAVEQTNIATPRTIGAVHLKPFLAIVLVRKVISRMVLLRRPSIRPSP